VQPVISVNAGSTPDGRTILAPLPEGIEGHFGPETAPLRADAIHQAIDAASAAGVLRSVGVSISKRQLQRLLTEKHDGFIAEAQDVLCAGLETSPWCPVDDTGARHAGRTAFARRLAMTWFTWFGTRSSKSRLNFLDLLRAGRTDYVLNDAAYDYMRNNGLPAATIARLMAEPQTRFSDQCGLAGASRLAGLAGLKVTPDPVRSPPTALCGAAFNHTNSSATPWF